ncbi:MAG TPA: hydrogen gas-evolving membrane-bound hydrogenase subunit E [Acidimicrobiia bacterium]|nr:hydrogen gas-evolving membrane-bound hydrogenase subunit E [Acidimicrobiia bacterium]
MIALIAIGGAVAAACAALGRRMGRRVFLVGMLAPAAAVIWLVGSGASPAEVVTESRAWIPQLGLSIDFRLDGLGMLMSLLIGAIGVLVFVYAWRYFGDREGLGRFAAYLVVFETAMLGLVLADNLLLLFVFWELTSITSYLLIGFDDESVAARTGALQALLVTGLGGLALLAGIVLLAQEGGTFSLSELLAQPPGGTATSVGLALVLLGAITKSAQFPFHFWLPGAMSAPTPVSAYLHSATMVKAGIYLIARFAPVFALIVAWWRPVVVAVGLVTMLVGGWRALAQHDLKLLLAQGTVSQLGLIVVLVGVGIPELTFAGMAMILAHAVFKAALFMIAGVVDHQAHTRDMRRLRGLSKLMPATFWLAVVATASMAGIPGLLGFVSKEAALEGLVHERLWLITAGVVAGSALTAAYGLRFLWGGFIDTDGEPAEGDGAVRAPRVSFLLGPAVLVVVTVVAGLAPALVDGLVGGAAGSVDPEAAAYHLAAWHGFGLPLGLSALALALGWLVWKRPLPRLRRLTSRLPEATQVYGRSLAAVNRFADKVTSVVQGGSLPVYLAVIMIVTVVAPGLVLISSNLPMPDLVLAENPIQVITVVLVSTAALATIIARRRLAAVIFLGAVGYGVAVLFVIQGAPDLALTQLLIETLVLTLFVLVLRVLPESFEVVQSRIRKVARIAISVGVGLFAGGFALVAAGGRRAPSLAEEYLRRAEPEGGGSNVVNVILTDFRALDTLGEITVLAVVAMGAMALLIGRHRPRQEDDGVAEQVETGEASR